MDKDEIWSRNVEKRLNMKAQRYDFITKANVIRTEWTCNCGATLKWYSEYIRKRHEISAKHLKALTELPQSPKEQQGLFQQQQQKMPS